MTELLACWRRLDHSYFCFRLGLGNGLHHSLTFPAASGLDQPVLHTAFVFTPQAGAFEGNRAGDHIVKKGSVMAHQEHGPFVVLQQFLQQFKGLDIEVVGWLVEHQHIGGSGKQARQQQAIALTA